MTSFLPPREIERAAREALVFRRQRKVRLIPFFWSLVLGFGAGRDRTLAGLRRSYEQSARHTLVPSAFYDRFTPAVVRWLKTLVAHVIAKTCEPVAGMRGPLSSFRDLVLTDSTVVRLHDLLAKAFPACRTNHTQAALKMHTVFSVAAAGLRSIKLTAERVHDGPVFQVGPWVRDRLLVFDLGYFRYQLMSCITRNGGFFIVRLKKSADPLIVATHRRWRGRAVALVGKRVSEIVERLQREVLDVEVEVRFKNRQYGGIRRSATMRLRLVGVRDLHTGEHHLYLTNIPPDRLAADEIAQTYAARWLVELFFRQLKSQLRFEDLPSRKRPIVEALIYATLLTFAVSRALKIAIQRRLGARAARVPDDRWHRLFAETARDLLRIVARRACAVTAALATDLERTLLHEAVDPNAGRALLLSRVESRSQFARRYALGGAR
jgi:IS4 transposase